MATIDAIENLSFILEKEWVSVFGFEGSKPALLEEFRGQLNRYGFDEKQKLTGKCGGRFKDDLVIAFMMAIFWSRQLEQPEGLNAYSDFLNGITKHQNMIKQGKVRFMPFYGGENTKPSLLPEEDRLVQDAYKKKKRKFGDLLNEVGKRPRSFGIDPTGISGNNQNDYENSEDN
jgi:hypothetical protein